MRNSLKKLFCKLECRENRFSGSQTLLDSLNEYLMIVTTFFERDGQICDRVFHTTPLSGYELCENGCSESHT